MLQVLKAASGSAEDQIWRMMYAPTSARLVFLQPWMNRLFCCQESPKAD